MIFVRDGDDEDGDDEDGDEDGVFEYFLLVVGVLTKFIGFVVLIVEFLALFSGVDRFGVSITKAS